MATRKEPSQRRSQRMNKKDNPIRDTTNLPQRPLRQQTENLPHKLNCSDISKDISSRLGVRSCFCCDNFRNDRGLFLPPGVAQDSVSQKKYGCRRKEKISVSIKFSHRNSVKKSQNVARW